MIDNMNKIEMKEDVKKINFLRFVWSDLKGNILLLIKKNEVFNFFWFGIIKKLF